MLEFCDLTELQTTASKHCFPVSGCQLCVLQLPINYLNNPIE